jgi:hypothetical protein
MWKNVHRLYISYGENSALTEKTDSHQPMISSKMRKWGKIHISLEKVYLVQKNLLEFYLHIPVLYNSRFQPYL